jgi:hypothetical protein
MTIYVSDELAAEIKAELGDQNISAICQTALRKELDRVKARTELAAEGFERFQIYSSRRRRNVTFKGRLLGVFDDDPDRWSAYLTPKNAIAVHYDDDDERSELDVYETYEQFIANEDLPDALLATVADALGEEYAEELDI